MTDETRKTDLLDDHFKALRDTATGPDDALMARVLADADATQVAHHATTAANPDPKPAGIINRLLCATYIAGCSRYSFELQMLDQQGPAFALLTEQGVIRNPGIIQIDSVAASGSPRECFNRCHRDALGGSGHQYH